MINLESQKRKHSGGEMPRPSLEEARKDAIEGVDVITVEQEKQDEQTQLQEV